MPQPNTITIDKTEYVRKDSIKTTVYKKSKSGPYEIGRPYYVLTVTMGIHGILVEVGEQELVLMDAAWIADTGRFAAALKSGNFEEVEAAEDGEIIVGRGAITDAWPIKTAPRVTK